MEDEPSYLFTNLQDLLHFIKWLTENFETPEDFEESIREFTLEEDDGLFDLFIDNRTCTRLPKNPQEVLECEYCGAIFVTSSGLSIHRSVIHPDEHAKDDDFWNIINNSYVGNNKGNNDDIHDTD